MSIKLAHKDSSCFFFLNLANIAMNGKGVAFLGPGSCVLFSDDTPNLKLRRLPLP